MRGEGKLHLSLEVAFANYHCSFGQGKVNEKTGNFIFPDLFEPLRGSN